jgi:alkanesulfonate monooxygenase SsuD/methylene tetrahydromethanopterin reductase-like flavin-dependent oxidoreductase (luciferase family)
MKFGAFFLSGSPDSEDPTQVFDRLSTYMTSAESLGFDSLWFAEHHFSNYGYIPNPLLMATKAASLTDGIRIGTAVLVLPFWNPLRVAEDIALTDHLTDGRLEVGVARGYQPFEFKRFGLTIDDARERTDETLEILLKALTQQTFTWQGDYFDIPETTILPAPKQQPTPPIWLAAHTQESFEIAARFGLNAFTTNSGRTIETLAEGWSDIQKPQKCWGFRPKSV